MSKDLQPVAPSLRNAMRSVTPARVALERTGESIATRDQLSFQLAHAQARDAVHAELDIRSLVEALGKRGLPCLVLRSAIDKGSNAAEERRAYLRRPDLGRKLAPDSGALLEQFDGKGKRIVFILADGLSALAVERHALPLLYELLPLLGDQNEVAPICIATQARVAIGDEIGHLLGAQLSVVLIGERPGLSSPDSLGAYLTWNPRPGRTDAERNCVSNIRAEGLSCAEAAQRLAYLMQQSLRLHLSGIDLKDGIAAVPTVAKL